jgi:hypothetical protein
VAGYDILEQPLAVPADELPGGRHAEGNQAAERVSVKLGYAPNGQRSTYRDGVGRATEHQFRLDRTAWERHARRDGVTISGLGPCLPMLGLDLPGASDDLEGRLDL